MTNQFSSTHFLNITENSEKQRIDNFLRKTFKRLPFNLICKIIRTGQIRINKKRINQNYKLKLGDSVRIPPITIQSDSNKKIKLNTRLSIIFNNMILYEDNYFLILNKPSGMSVHSGSGINYGMIENLRILRPYNRYLDLVHRLDRDTSGVLIIAKKRSILRNLHEQLREKKIKKKYVALVHGVWPDILKSISKPLLKTSSRKNKNIVKIDPKGKESITHFNIKKKYTKNTLISITPITGRTHQIRVHLLHLNYPIVLDAKYGIKKLDYFIKNKFNINRLLLHAESINFFHPKRKKNILITAPLDYVFKTVLKNLI
ncbi:ribosomal large subunit pseudouridine synthase D [Buchnera aphidicola str. Bp (Baizongia pistaciae)]|uniref:Ribosomal large subunit pseudouridine synthase C n=1 Tax=Buchnera aphidicola subsp. Baizongia pistaciae (strain Bp) TaxID=224915 RepID=RLUC_BUCBP|nr:RluA family pseudouridine synthase [Buchnera aphidicola]Q89AH2.1 RecName: Full=Ribosomal large subunit pseudouridine synthase C; AltName: Full=23S rRNA pseudouridine(955/2504/2580) synthase; AltName: Full=rRNA pseudouridylate synthase C; AltName: Full=rRNA-uridine isomerase C [Buchnera aphidicola str. Bp (Baizongia pistaciae)]AAO27040.1 ribosomal large subunit pseudouridine synthase D [Buchnera aphidicola str. Bp (Baizongia pistaciae)]